MLSQAVVKVGDFAVTRDELSFDMNNNGFLDVYTEGDNPELNSILKKYTKKKSESVLVINRDIHRSYRLKKAVSIGDTIIIIKYQDDKIRKKQIEKLYIGNDSIETLNIIDVRDDTLYLKSPVVKGYPESVLVWRNVAGISTLPQIVKYESKDLNRVIVHERLHCKPFGLLDLENEVLTQDNIMLYYDTIGARKLRNRKLKIRKGNDHENQWDKIMR